MKTKKRDDLLQATRKKQYVEIAAEYAGFHVSEQGKHRMETCGDWLWMLENDAGDKRKLEKGFFCGSRWCPACAWRYSAAWGRTLMAIDRYLTEEQKLVPIFVTLTVPNVPADKLRDTLDHMAASWNRLMKRKDYRAWKNFARKVEVTYNAERYDYHPHYHVLIWVRKGYFSGRNYISHDKLLADWRDVTGMPEITQVDVRRCRSAEQEGAAVAEVAKYCAKSSDFLLDQSVFDGFYAGLKGVRIMSLGGEAKKAVKMFRRGELSKYDPEQPDDLAEYVWRVVYGWIGYAGEYSEIKRTPVDLAEEAAARQLHAQMRQADMRAIANGWTPMTGKTYRQTRGGTRVDYTPVEDPWSAPAAGDPQPRAETPTQTASDAQSVERCAEEGGEAEGGDVPEADRACVARDRRGAAPPNTAEQRPPARRGRGDGR